MSYFEKVQSFVFLMVIIYKFDFVFSPLYSNNSGQRAALLKIKKGLKNEVIHQVNNKFHGVFCVLRSRFKDSCVLDCTIHNPLTVPGYQRLAD